MDEILQLLNTPESCERFARNVEARQPEQARLARRKAVQLNAVKEGATNEIERACWEAV